MGIPLPSTLQSVPFPALAAAVCLAAAIFGVAVLDDYGVAWDERAQRQLAILNADYVLGDSDALPKNHNRYYGIAVEMPLLLAERGLGLRDSRDIHLMRHLLTHLFFILGAFFCGLLAYRMFGSRGLAMLAMLMFLLHPRLYAHSFFNSKDIPFAVMFMIALHLTHRAFCRETIGAFALCGLAVGLACNLRVFGLLLPPVVLAMRALDLWCAGDEAERRRILASAGAFVAAALATMYVLAPYYWANPLRFVEGLQVLSQHPSLMSNLFQGEEFRADEVPPHFIPTWFAITAPPVTLLLAGVGAAVSCATSLAHPRRTLRNGGVRFRLLLLGCATLPVAVVIALQARIYDDWRHLYFLWAPVSLLAAAGLRWLVVFGEPSALKARLVLGGVGAGLVCVLASMASLHPHQQVYFNWLADRRASPGLAHRFEMDYQSVAIRQGLEFLLERYPGAVLHVWGYGGLSRNLEILQEPDRQRILVSPWRTADFLIEDNRRLRGGNLPFEPVVYERSTYGSAYLQVVAPKSVWGAPWSDGDGYRKAHLSLLEGVVAKSHFHMRPVNGALYYIREDCSPVDTETRFFLHVFPLHAKDLPAHRRTHGFDNRDFDFDRRGGFFEGFCITWEPLPDYPIARVRTGQFVRGGPVTWKADFPLIDATTKN